MKSTTVNDSKTKHDWRWSLWQIWQGMTFSVWVHLLWRNRFAVSPIRWALAAFATLCSLSNSLLMLLSEALFARRAARTLVKPPIFIIGHWRTGTTLLHELLTLDDRHSYPSTYACLQPHHFVLTAWWGRLLWRWMLPARRAMDEMDNGPNRPQEDEFALCHLGLPSPYASLAFPRHRGDDQASLDLETLPPRQRQRWKKGLMWFLKRLTLMDSRRLVLKSPTHTARIKTLLELFPDAQFVHIVRDPFVVFSSSIHTWKTLRRAQSLQVSAEDDELEEYVFNNFETMYHAFDRDRHLIDPENFIEVRYEDLIGDMTVALRSIYDHLELGEFEAVCGKLKEFDARSRNYRTNRYEISADLRQRVYRRWRQHIDRWGYAPKSAGCVAEAKHAPVAAAIGS